MVCSKCSTRLSRLATRLSWHPPSRNKRRTTSPRFMAPIIRSQKLCRDYSRSALTVLGVGKYNCGLPLGFGGEMYAVIQTGGKQYRVAPGDTIRIERVKGDVGEQVKFGSILSVHTDDKRILTGDDATKATVTGKIVQQGRSKKVTVLKFKKTNQYKIQRGHRQNFTAVQVSEIKL